MMGALILLVIAAGFVWALSGALIMRTTGSVRLVAIVGHLLAIVALYSLVSLFALASGLLALKALGFVI